MLIRNLKQFGIGSAFFMFVLVATGLAKAISTQNVLVASADHEIEMIDASN